MCCRLKTERTGFEPVDQLLTGHVFSKDAHSTTLPPLLNGKTRYYRVPLDENVRASHSEALADYLQGGTEEAAWKCLVLQFADTI